MYNPTPQHVFINDGIKFYEAKWSARNMADLAKFSHLEWPAWAWPGGYPLFYTTKDGGCLCPTCANDNLELTVQDDPQWEIVGQEINYEDTELYCDNCGEHIEGAYT